MGYQRLVVRLTGGRAVEVTVIQQRLLCDWPDDLEYRPDDITAIDLVR